MTRVPVYTLLLVSTLLCCLSFMPVDAGEPRSPGERFSAIVQSLDPDKRLFVGVKEGDQSGRIVVTVTPAFHAAPYQERLQLVQAMGQAWDKISGSSRAMVIVTDKGPVRT